MADFDWDNKGDVLFQSVQAVAVFPNADANIVIRQQADSLEDQDHIIIFPPHFATVVAEAILRAAKEVAE